MVMFKHIALFSRRQMSPAIVETLTTILHFLKNQPLQVSLEAETAQAAGLDQVSILSVEQIGKTCDLVMVIGGDGSLLGAAHEFVDYKIPILGINRGQLGFLTDINPQEISTQLEKVLNGEYREESRFLLNAKIKAADDGIVLEHTALNEVTLYAGHAAQLIAFEVYIDNQFVYKQRSDGLIIATPTGSTAYALSGGGPILHPSLDCVVLVPMLPHTLTSRPIVISNNSLIEIVIISDMKDKPDVSWDGHRAYSLNPRDRIRISRHQQALRLIHPDNYDYYETLRTKLQWSTS